MASFRGQTTGPKEVILLQTKLNRPPLTADLVVRPRLLQKLDAGLTRKLTFVSAPAGFGKTTLVASWLASLDSRLQSAIRTPAQPVATTLVATPALSAVLAQSEALPERALPSAKVPRLAWVSLDEGDNNLVQFLAYVIAAAQIVFPDACLRTQALLETSSQLPVDYFVSLLLNEIIDLSEEFVLVLDDYHVIRDPEIGRFVNAMLARMPPNLHVVLITRRDPALPLARLRVQQQLVEIRTTDLRFSVEEASTFLCNALGCELCQEAIVRLDDRIEGWIAALRLAAIAIRESDDRDAAARSLGGMQRHVMNYLVEQVLLQQPPAVHDFLVRTSVLERLCAPLCDAVLAAYPAGQNGLNSKEILERLERANLFVVPLDEERRWYRYHHLFRDLMHLRLQVEADAEEIAGLHRQAGAWLGQHGCVEEGLRAWLAAGDTGAAAALVEEHAQALLNAEAQHTLQSWLDLLPAALITSRPALMVAVGWVKVFHAQLAALPPLLLRAEALLPPITTEPAHAHIQCVRGHIEALWSQYYWSFTQDPERAAAHGAKAVTWIPDGDTFARDSAMIMLALALNQLGRRTEALSLLEQGTDQIQQVDGSATTRLPIALSAIHLLSADLPRLVSTAQGLLASAEAKGRLNSQASAHYFLGCAHLLRNESDSAAQHFSWVAGMRYHSNAKTYHDSLHGLALALQSLGRPDEADACVTRALDFAMGSLHPADVSESRAIQIRLALLRQDEVADLPWNQPDTAPSWNLNLEMPGLTHVRLLLARGGLADLGEAEACLLQLLEANMAVHDDRRVVEALVLGAMLDRRLDRTDAALEKLQRAVVLAQPGGIVRCFLEAASDMAVLLPQLPAEGTTSAFVAQLLAALSGAPQPVARPRAVLRQGDELIHTLTNREEEVLLLLAQRLTDKEIAQALFISPLTVRKHTTNIFQKLHVENRRQAVTKARACGLLTHA